MVLKKLKKQTLKKNNLNKKIRGKSKNFSLESEKLIEKKLDKTIKIKSPLKKSSIKKKSDIINFPKGEPSNIKNELKKIADEKKKQDKIEKRHNQLKKFTSKGLAKIISLDNYLEKAGIDNLTSNKVISNIARLTFITCSIVSVIFIVFSLISQKSMMSLITLLLGFWVTFFPLIFALYWVIFLVYLDLKIFHRTNEIEHVFPDFLQLTSANISAGMPIDKALWYAVRPSFGVLAKEIEIVAKTTMAGEELSLALTTFAKKYNSKMIQQSVNLLLEGVDAGGEIADLLSKISLNIEETKILKKEMAASVTTYVIFITFASIIAAPVLFGLSTQLLIVIKGITANMSGLMTSSSSFFSFSFSSEGIKTSNFRIFCYLMLTITSIF